MNVVLYGNFAASQKARIQQYLQTPCDLAAFFDDADRAEKAAALAQADVLVSTGYGANDPPAPRIRLLQCASAGTDRVDLTRLPPECIFCNVFGHEIAIAEYIIGSVLYWALDLNALGSVLKKGTWTLPEWTGGPEHGEAYGSTIGIVGFGRIGREVAVRAKALGMRVLALSAWRSGPPDMQLLDGAFESADAETFVRQCDYFSVCAPLSDETRALVNARWFSCMKSSAVVISVGRGEVIEEAALYRALQDGQIRAASIDVWYRYPKPSGEAVPPSAFPFHELPNIVMTPHASGRTHGTWDRRFADVARNIDAFARGEPLMNVISR